VADEQHRRIRKSEEEIQAILSRLESNSDSSSAANLRNSTRYSYRVQSLVAEFPNQNQTISHAVPARNISREGVAFLLGSFVYPGTRCRVRLVSEYEHAQVISGVVKRCRYVEGSANVYEVGMKFDRPIDVATFQRDAARVSILLADEDTFHHQLVEKLLRSLSVDLVCVADGRTAVAEATARPFDLILMSIDLPELDGLAAMKELRGNGYGRPIVAVTADTRAGVREEYLGAGFTECVDKPLRRDDLEAVVHRMKSQPLVSSLVQDPHMSELIDQFVNEIAQGVGQLEQAFAHQDQATLLRLARTLKGRAGACGFDAISAAAGALEDTVSSDAAPDTVRAELNELVRWCLSARPVSCVDD